MAGSRETSQQLQTRPETGFPNGPRGGGHAWPRGCRVRVRGRRWHVEESRAFTDCHLLVLSGIGRSDRGRRLPLLLPFDRPRRLVRSAGLRRVTWRRWLRAFRALAANTTPYGRLATASAARIDLHAYQIEPSLALLNGMATRVLLADEVGLGKTIQAGLFLSELHARLSAPRSLILVPAGLRDQWAAELRDRFAMEATVVDAAALRRALGRLAAGKNPWAIWPLIVTSLDFVKRPDVLRALDDFTWDALVVDEAHQCAIAHDRSAAVRLLASRSRHVLLVTATPHAGDDQAFDELCGIGRLQGGEPIVMFRRSRLDVGISRTRRVHLLRIRCSDAEGRMHRLLERYTKAVWRSPDASGDARLAMIVLRKRALSSAVALAQSLERRLEALFDAPPAGTQIALPFDGAAEPDEQSPEDDEAPGCLAAPGMEGARERAWLARLLDAARDAATGESKLRRLRRLLAAVRQPAIVFTEYRDTAHWLAAALQPVGGVALLHGALSRAERQDAERRFRLGHAQFLVATDAAGQGLNLHHRCRLVVNLELPWNPMRLEQRIGRVDRLGQTRRPHAIHLVARQTAEEQIVRRLVVRQRRARLRVGEVGDAVGATSEDEVAAAVMAGNRIDGDACEEAASRGTGLPSPRDRESTFRTVDVSDLAAEEVDRLWSARRVSAPARPASDHVSDRGAVLAFMPRRRVRRSRMPPGLLCVYTVRATDAAEEAVDESLVPLHLDLGPGPPRVIAPLRDIVDSETLKQAAVAHVASRMQRAMEAFRRVTANAVEREDGLATARRHPLLLQPGMFDRRALVEAEREAAGESAREMERTERLSILAARMAGSLDWRAELALVLVIPDP